MATSYKDDPYLSPVSAKLLSSSDPLEQYLENVKEVIERSERDAIFSEEVAQAAREELGSRFEDLGNLSLKILRLHESLSKAGFNAALLTRDEMLVRLNELGYPLTSSYLKSISTRRGGYSGPPTAERWGKQDLYRLDEVVDWARAQRLGAVRGH